MVAEVIPVVLLVQKKRRVILRKHEANGEAVANGRDLTLSAWQQQWAVYERGPWTALYTAASSLDSKKSRGDGLISHLVFNR